MPNTYYSARKTGDGGAMFINVAAADGVCYLKLVKQTGWNEQTNNGSFQGGDTINFQLSQDEMAEISRVVRSKGIASLYHKSPDGVNTTARFNYYKQPNQDPAKPAREGFGLTVKKGDIEIKLGLSLGSAYRLALLMENFLNRIFNDEVAKDVQEQINYRNSKSNNAPAMQSKQTQSAPKKMVSKPAPKKVEPTPEPEPSAEEDQGNQEGQEEDVPF